MQSISFIKSKKILRYNLELFTKKYNYLFITGLSGSGKTTISKSLSKAYNNATILNLDCFSGYFHKEYNNTKIKEITATFFETEPQILSIIQNKKYMELKLTHFEKYIEYNNKYIMYLLKYCEKHPEQNFIIEGTQIFMTLEPNFLKGKSLIIVRTSALKSLWRRLQRQLTIEEKRQPFTIGKKHIKKILNDAKRLHFKDVLKINHFISVLEKNIRNDK